MRLSTEKFKESFKEQSFKTTKDIIKYALDNDIPLNTISFSITKDLNEFDEISVVKMLKEEKNISDKHLDVIYLLANKVNLPISLEQNDKKPLFFYKMALFLEKNKLNDFKDVFFNSLNSGKIKEFLTTNQNSVVKEQYLPLFVSTSSIEKKKKNLEEINTLLDTVKLYSVNDYNEIKKNIDNKFNGLLMNKGSEERKSLWMKK